MIDSTPIYNLKAVIQETGLGPETLRAWERRYGLLKPQRSPGGHRLYSQYDIDMLKWLVASAKRRFAHQPRGRDVAQPGKRRPGPASTDPLPAANSGGWWKHVGRTS